MMDHREDAFYVDGESVHSRSVMVVDDNDAIRLVIESILDDMGLPVVSLASGYEAVDYYHSHHAKVLLTLLDWKMPGMDGQETFYALRSIRPDARIVIVSGFIEPEIVSDLWQSGLAGFIHKPFELDEVADAVRTALRAQTPNETRT